MSVYERRVEKIKTVLERCTLTVATKLFLQQFSWVVDYIDIFCLFAFLFLVLYTVLMFFKFEIYLERVSLFLDFIFSIDLVDIVSAHHF